MRIIRKWITLPILSLLFLCGIATGCTDQADRDSTTKTVTAPYHYSDGRFDFQVDVPESWTIEEDVLVEATEEQEASPTSGITISIDGNSEDRIYVYGQHGTIGTSYEGYDEEEIVTKAGEKGTLFRSEADGQVNVNFVHENRHYGVAVNVSVQTYQRLEEAILGVIQSLKVSE